MIYKMLSIFFKKVELYFIAILGAVSLFLIGRNSNLSKTNKKLNQDNSNQSSVIEVQKKVIHVAKNTKPTDIGGNLERMRQDKL
tara:strand:+ start:2227 stop:2478 length:252 start_codon:yes stop_codon:yes gene_type:complete